jgi:2-amino-4-hydroxy-6-hydroxymethyldihydropteridine diphosphokinase
LRSSSLYRTAPVGNPNQPDFFNAAALIQTTLAPRALLDALLAIERIHGRERSVQNAPRTLDLDLLLYGDRLIEEPGLVVPHPRMHERRFVLDPLVEITPYCIIPGRGAARDWLEQSLDQRVERL